MPSLSLEPAMADVTLGQGQLHWEEKMESWAISPPEKAFTSVRSFTDCSNRGGSTWNSHLRFPGVVSSRLFEAQWLIFTLGLTF